MTIILCGMPRAGKSTLGSYLANILNCPFIDTDRLVEEAYFQKSGTRLTCRDLHLKEGERIFRAYEEAVIEAFACGSKSVIALGGGAPMSMKNRERIKALGRVVFLDISFDLLWKRMQVSPIPSYLMNDEPFQALDRMMRERRPLYLEISGSVVEPDGQSIEEMAQRILHGE